MAVRRRHPQLPPAPAASSPATRASMRGNRSTNTSPEAKLEVALQEAGICGYTTNAKGLPGSPDFAFPLKRLAVFVHGCFWHRCPYCQPHFPGSNVEYWTAKFQRNRERDAQNRAQLRAMGWKPLVVWECRLRVNPKAAAARIKRHLEARVG